MYLTKWYVKVAKPFNSNIILNAVNYFCYNNSAIIVIKLMHRLHIGTSKCMHNIHSLLIGIYNITYIM